MAQMLKFSCPECDNQLRVSHMHIGKQIHCPKCQTSCEVPDPEVLAEESRRQGKRSADRPKKRQPQPARAGSVGLVLGVVAGSALLMLMVVAVLAFALYRAANPPRTNFQAKISGPPRNPTPLFPQVNVPTEPNRFPPQPPPTVVSLPPLSESLVVKSTANLYPLKESHLDVIRKTAQEQEKARLEKQPPGLLTSSKLGGPDLGSFQPAISWGGQWVAIWYAPEAQVQIWDVSTGALASKLTANGRNLLAGRLLFSPDNNWVLAFTGSGVSCFSVKEQRMKWERNFPGRVEECQFLGDLTHCVLRVNYKLMKVNLESSISTELQVPANANRAVKLLDDGVHALLESPLGLVWWDYLANSAKCVLSLPKGLMAHEFSATGQYILLFDPVLGYQLRDTTSKTHLSLQGGNQPGSCKFMQLDLGQTLCVAKLKDGIHVKKVPDGTSSVVFSKTHPLFGHIYDDSFRLVQPIQSPAGGIVLPIGLRPWVRTSALLDAKFADMFKPKPPTEIQYRIEDGMVHVYLNANQLSQVHPDYVSRLYVHNVRSKEQLDPLSRFQNLEELSVWSMSTTAELSLAPLKHTSRLRRLELSLCRLPEESVTLVNRLTSLETLRLRQVSIVEAPNARFLIPETLRILTLVSSPQVDFKTLQKATQLAQLHLEDVRLTDADFDALKHTPSLQTLTLQRQEKLSAKNLAGLAWMSQLRTLTISKTTLEDGALQSISKLHNVIYCTLQDTNITDADLVHLATWRKTANLNLGGTNITGAGFVHLENWTAMQTIELSNCLKFTGVGFRHLANCKNLKHVNLFWTPISDEGLDEICQLQQIERVHLPSYSLLNSGFSDGNKPEYARLTPKGLLHLQKLQNLRSLDLGSSPITDANVAELAKLRSLQSLSFGSTNVSNAAIKHLKEHPNLLSLTLPKQITSECIPDLVALPKLSWVDCDFGMANEDRVAIQKAVADLVKSRPKKP